MVRLKKNIAVLLTAAILTSAPSPLLCQTVLQSPNNRSGGMAQTTAVPRIAASLGTQNLPSFFPKSGLAPASSKDFSETVSPAAHAPLLAAPKSSEAAFP